MKKEAKILLICIALLLCSSVLPLSQSTAYAQDLDKGQITGSNVTMRKEASSNSAVLCKLAKGTVVNILQVNVDAQWDKIEYNGKTGYVNRVYVSLDPSLDQYNFTYMGTVTNVNKYVTLRSAPSTGASTVTTANKGAALAVLKYNYATGWHQVGVNGKIAYVATKYLNVLPKVNDNQLSSLTVSGGSLSPSFSPSESGYVVDATKASVTIKAKANGGVKIDINDTGKSSAAISIPSGGMRTVRIKLNGTIRYTLYITRNLLTVGTWNIKRGDGNLPMQGRLVSNQQPDILAIQEAYQDYTVSNVVDNLASLKTANMPYTKFASTINYSNGSQYGIGILSHYGMSGVKTYKLDSSGYEPRILLKTVISVGGKKVSVYNTHFSYESAEARAKEFAGVLAVMKKDTNKYKMLFGDFNAKENEFSVFSGYTVANTSDTNFIDSLGKSFRNIVIDNIIVTRNIKVVNMRAIQTSLSDHNPVFAYLVLK